MRIRFPLRLATLLSVIVLCVTAQPAFAAERALTGVVTNRYGNQIVLKTTAAVLYRVEASYASLVRRNGSALSMEEVMVGDKLEVQGRIWGDNSVSASTIRDVSVYTHTGTFSGKVVSVDFMRGTLVLQGAQSGLQTIHTTVSSAFTRNGSSIQFKDIAVGMSATVKGTWERTKQEVVATSIRTTVRLLNIDLTGEVTTKDGLALTVVSNGVLYAVDSAGATVKSKNNKSMALTELGLGRVRVWGKHIAESVAIQAIKIKYLDVVK